MDYQHITVTPLSSALGAVITGVNLSDGPPRGAQLAEIRRAWLEHLVVFFPDQPLSPDAYLAFASAFAEPVDYPMLDGLQSHPKIVEVIKQAHETHNFGGLWHSDTAYLAEPPIAAMLLAREVPTTGGDTLFANMYLAWEGLSAGMRSLLEGLQAVNTSARAEVSRSRQDLRMGQDREIEVFEATHPVARVHGETGRTLLYVNYAHTVRFSGMSERESRGLLEYLFEHQTRPEYCCRFSWSPGTIAFWDNRACQHNPVNDYHGEKRVMQRISLGAERPVGGQGSHRPASTSDHH